LAREGRGIYEAQFPYVKGRLGGYGLHYAGVIAGMGLALPGLPSAGLAFDAPTPEGRAVAAALRSAVAGTRYYQEFFDDDDAEVPTEVILEYIRVACLCQLQTRSAPDRPILQDVFLHAGQLGEPDARRATMRMFLDIADQTSGHPLTEDRFRQLVYFRSDLLGASWAPNAPNVHMARRWRLYQAREYYAYALNRLWEYLSEWGSVQVHASGASVAIEKVWEHFDAAVNVGPLAARLRVEGGGLNAASTLADLDTWVRGAAAVSGDLDTPWEMSQPLHEHSLYRFGATGGLDPLVVPACLSMLALVAARLAAPATQLAYADDWDICRDGQLTRLGLERFFARWRRRLSSSATLSEVIRWIVGDYIVRQHERVATAKLTSTGDTFRFRRVGSQLHFFDGYAGAQMSNSRFQALATTVHELGFVDNLLLPDSLTDRVVVVGGDLLGDPRPNDRRSLWGWTGCGAGGFVRHPSTGVKGRCEPPLRSGSRSAFGRPLTPVPGCREALLSKRR
jgi:hypothetical protein